MKRLLSLVLFCSLLTAAGATELRRYALFVGADNGGAGRTVLRYAVSDAQALKRVLTELGGLTSNNSQVLGNPDRNSVLSSLAGFAPRIAQGKKAGDRAEFLFYYSGHSDENGLLLGNTRIGYGELRDALAKVGADVRLAVLDSCASGAFTRLKGGTKSAPFFQDESASLEGHAYLTSSSENEASQESDRIGGSFFTHYLISGLRGAADATGDGRVSLNEAYRHAFDETLARTEDTQAGPQHPSYDIQLSGTGDLVLTDLTRRTSRLVLAADVGGQLFVRTATGALVAEVRKTTGEALTLAVPAGIYDVALQTASGYGLARRTVADGEVVNMAASDLALGAKQPTRSRGGIADSAYLPLNFGFTPGLELYPGSEKTTAVALYALLSVAGHIRAAQISGIGNISESNTGFQSAGVFNLTQSSQGFQSAGVFNKADSVRGFQSSGVLNIAEDVSGFQVAGVVNIARDVRGFQIGVVNIAQHVDGFALGLVNISDESWGRVGFDYDQRGGAWATFEWGAGALSNIVMIAEERGTVGAGLGLSWGKGIRLGTQLLAFVDRSLAYLVPVTPALRLAVNAKLGVLGIHAGWLGTAYFPEFTSSNLVGGPGTSTTDAFTSGYPWHYTGRLFFGMSVGF